MIARPFVDLEAILDTSHTANGSRCHEQAVPLSSQDRTRDSHIAPAR